MLFFSRHIDQKLERLSQGALGARAVRGLVAHARGCPRCRVRYDRFVLAQRVLQTGSPRGVADFELAALQVAAWPAVVGAARPGTAPPSRFSLPVLALGAVAAGLVAVAGVLVAPALRGPAPEFSARGGAAGAGVLRAFCATQGKPLRELKDEPSCPAGTTLVFAAAAPRGRPHLAIALRGSDREIVLGPVAVPVGDAVTPLAISPALALPAGPAEIVGAFAERPEDALAAARGGAVEGVVLVRQPLRVGEPQ